MPALNDRTITELEALDRRLLALAGDVQSPLAHEVEMTGTGSHIAVSVGLEIPVGDEVSRIEGEFDAIWGGLTALAGAAGVTLPDDIEERYSRLDAEAAYAAMRRRVEHQRRWLGVVRGHVPGAAVAGPAVDSADDPTSRDVTGHVRRWLTPWAQGVIGVPMALIMFFGIRHCERTRVREVAVHLCARPSPCPGDAMSIAYGRIVDRRSGNGLVVYRRSGDCSHTVEVYHDDTGYYRFRGSLDDPDLAARAEFRAAREAWHAEHEIVSTVPCDRADEL